MLEASGTTPGTSPILDLFAGSGAAGIEALSRGAPRAVFVEHDGRAAGVIAREPPTHRPRRARPRRPARRAVAVLRRGAGRRRRRGALRASSCSTRRTSRRPTCATRASSTLGDADARAGWTTMRCVVAKHFWRDRPPDAAGHARARARPALRRDRADRVSSRRADAAAGAGADERWPSTRELRPDHARPPRRHRRAARVFERLVVGGPRRTPASRPRSPPTTRARDHPRRDRRGAAADGAGARRGHDLRRPDGGVRPPRSGPASSSAACARSATSRASSRWPT